MTGDNVHSLAFTDYNLDGRQELLVGSEDYDIRVFHEDELLHEISESDTVISLCSLGNISLYTSCIPLYILLYFCISLHIFVYLCIPLYIFVYFWIFWISLYISGHNKFGYALTNGIVGVYSGDQRIWHSKV